MFELIGLTRMRTNIGFQKTDEIGITGGKLVENMTFLGKAGEFAINIFSLLIFRFPQ